MQRLIESQDQHIRRVYEVDRKNACMETDAWLQCVVSIKRSCWNREFGLIYFVAYRWHRARLKT